ncbi:hypothetical protein QTN25_009165 [Entamoeba marina]
MKLRAPKLTDFIRRPYLWPIINVVLYLVICFLLTYLIQLILIPFGKSHSSPYQVTLIITMYIPAFSAYLVYAINRQKLPSRFKKFNLKFKKNWLYYLIGAYLGPSLLCTGVVCFYIFNVSLLDINMNTMVSSQKINNLYYGVDISDTWIRVELWYSIILNIIVAPLVNLGVTLGEEIGWRSFLFVEMSKVLHPRISTWVCGIIWGLWHAVLVCYGLNYGSSYSGHPYTGILMMCVATTFTGNINNFFMLKTGNVLIPAMLHSSVNALGALAIYWLDTTEYAKDPVSSLLGYGALGVENLIPYFILGTVVVIFMFFDDVNPFREDLRSGKAKYNLLPS